LYHAYSGFGKFFRPVVQGSAWLTLPGESVTLK
jgi:hypothetical protein